jgi:hypothetical protein
VQLQVDAQGNDMAIIKVLYMPFISTNHVHLLRMLSMKIAPIACLLAFPTYA